MAATPYTALKVVNRILVRLREAEVSSITDSEYSRLLLGLVNDAKREVEDSFNWSSLKDTITVATVGSTSSLSITDGVSGYTNSRSRLVEVYNSTSDDYLEQRSRDYVRRRANEDPTETRPDIFAVDGLDSSQNLKIELHNTPDTAYTLKITVYNPQEDLTDDEDLISVPWMPVYLRAYALAVRERGDDEGQSAPEAFQEYMTALNDAIAYEQRHKFDNTFDGDWHVVSNGF